MSQGDRSRAFSDVNLIHPLTRNELHSLKDIQAPRSRHVVEHDLGVFAIQAQHSNLLGPRYSVRETGVYSRVRLKRLITFDV